MQVKVAEKIQYHSRRFDIGIQCMGKMFYLISTLDGMKNKLVAVYEFTVFFLKEILPFETLRSQ